MIPQNEPLRSRWLNAIKRKDFVPNKHRRLCSLHFKQEKKMGSTDVPVIFPLLPKPVFRKLPKKRFSQISKSVKKSTLKPATQSKSSCESKDISTESDVPVKMTKTLVKELQQQVTELKSKVEALTAENWFKSICRQ